jgi:hypothetical protein
MLYDIGSGSLGPDGKLSAAAALKVSPAHSRTFCPSDILGGKLSYRRRLADAVDAYNENYDGFVPVLIEMSSKEIRPVSMLSRAFFISPAPCMPPSSLAAQLLHGSARRSAPRSARIRVSSSSSIKFLVGSREAVEHADKLEVMLFLVFARPFLSFQKIP